MTVLADPPPVLRPLPRRQRLRHPAGRPVVAFLGRLVNDWMSTYGEDLLRAEARARGLTVVGVVRSQDVSITDSDGTLIASTDLHGVFAELEAGAIQGVLILGSWAWAWDPAVTQLVLARIEAAGGFVEIVYPRPHWTHDALPPEFQPPNLVLGSRLLRALQKLP